jgi:hypothetical protein
MAALRSSLYQSEFVFTEKTKYVYPSFGYAWKYSGNK